MLDKYPDVTLEEAEVLVDLLGWEDQMKDWACHCCKSLDDLPKNLFIYGLLGILFHELEDVEPKDCSLTAQQIPMCRGFLDRAQACERHEVHV